jgi:hypothetical protein
VFVVVFVGALSVVVAVFTDDREPVVRRSSSFLRRSRNVRSASSNRDKAEKLSARVNDGEVTAVDFTGNSGAELLVRNANVVREES